MDWMAAIGGVWLNTLGWLALLAAAFGVMVRLMPCNPGMYWWKDLRAVATDFMYWFVVPLFTRICRTMMLIAGVALLFGGKDPQFLPVQGLPLWQQCLAILLIQDVILYWAHRLFHTRPAWKFHAIHHSPKVLDWMSTGRSHFVNNLLTFSLADVAVLLMGFAPAALVVLTPFNLAYSAMVHANLNWTFGPLRYLFASPVFHRWHHTTQEEGLDKNFASTFPLLDVIFGTFYMPPGKLPEQFGNGDPDFPEGFWGQFIHPFTKPARPAERAPGRARRPAAALIAVSVPVLGSLLGGGLYFTAPLAGRNEQPPEAVGPAKLQPSRAEAAGQAIQLGQAGRARADHAVLGVAVSADGHCLVTGSADGTVKVWDAATGRERLTLTGHARPVHSVAVSADGHRIVTGSADLTAKVWDAQTGQEQRTLVGHTRTVLSVAVSADGRCIVTGSADMTAKVWDAQTGQELRTLAGHLGAVLGVAVSADGRHIVTAGGGSAKVWDAQTGREGPTLTGHTDLVYGVAISPDGRRIVSGSFDESVKVWDAATGQERLTLTGHRGPVYSVAVGPDGGCIVSGGKDQTVRVWDAATGRAKHTFTGHTDAVTGVTVSADGHWIVSGSRDGTMKVWDAQKGEQATVQEVGRNGPAS
jgi:sterol desaturase/sphingolipid hydroxylase (fatty acid hydroxylase superfamily)